MTKHVQSANLIRPPSPSGEARLGAPLAPLAAKSKQACWFWCTCTDVSLFWGKPKRNRGFVRIPQKRQTHIGICRERLVAAAISSQLRAAQLSASRPSIEVKRWLSKRVLHSASQGELMLTPPPSKQPRKSHLAHSSHCISNRFYLHVLHTMFAPTWKAKGSCSSWYAAVPAGGIPPKPAAHAPWQKLLCISFTNGRIGSLVWR